MKWRVALIDSCGVHAKATVGVAFVSDGHSVRRRECVHDDTGHGTRIAGILTGGAADVDLVLGQVFAGRSPTSAAAVAAAIDWSVEQEADLVHLSLGLTADRAVLRDAVSRAVETGLLLVAALPARGQPVFPSSYAGVIAATGDARCTPRELSHLGSQLFGGCPRLGVDDQSSRIGGASIGAAWVSRRLMELTNPRGLAVAEAVEVLNRASNYRGRERVTVRIASASDLAPSA
jgi:subtilisin family serine protease